MPYSNGRAAFGRRGGTVTVIEEPVRRSSVRNAKITFWVLWVALSLLAITIASSYWPPIVALFAGLVAGFVVAMIVAAFVVAWPVLRAIWWWSIEITTVLGLVFGWIQLAEHTTLLSRLAVVALVVGLPAAIPPARRYIVGIWWCLAIRHRIRTCFSEFIITNRTGSLPLILWAWPTAVGVRTWIWLRPGLALEDVQQRLDLIAVACWAASATAEAVSGSNSARIRMDIKRRDALTGTVRSPLIGMVSPDTPDVQRDAMPVPTALDLPDVAAADVAPIKSSRNGTRTPPVVPVIKPVVVPAPGDDIEDWI